MGQFTLLSHNAFWFQGVPFPTDRPPEPDTEILQRLCAIYRDLKPDVVCLQEIQNEEAFRMVSEELEMPGCYCRGEELPQYGGATFWASPRGEQIHSSHESALATQRMWQIVEVGRSDFCLRIGNVHLPSQRQLGPQRSAEQRVAETLEAVNSCEVGLDFIAGDFNEQYGGSVSECLEEHDYVDAAAISDWIEKPTSIAGGRGDFIWMREQASNSLLNYGVVGKRELECGDGNKRYLSDHLPLWITVEVR